MERGFLRGLVGEQRIERRLLVALKGSCIGRLIGMQGLVCRGVLGIKGIGIRSL